MSEILQVLASLSVLLFVITSMLALGLSLTIKQIIAPFNSATDPDILVMIIVVSMIGLILLMLMAGELGRRKAEPGLAAEGAAQEQ